MSGSPDPGMADVVGVTGVTGVTGVAVLLARKRGPAGGRDNARVGEARVWHKDAHRHAPALGPLCLHAGELRCSAEQVVDKIGEVRRVVGVERAGHRRPADATGPCHGVALPAVLDRRGPSSLERAAAPGTLAGRTDDGRRPVPAPFDEQQPASRARGVLEVQLGCIAHVDVAETRLASDVRRAAERGGRCRRHVAQPVRRMEP